jgi:putative ABC transport system permease protein
MQTFSVTVLGGLIGAGLGLGGLHLINAIVSRAVLSVPIASTHPGLALYGILAAVVIGLITLPYVRYLLGQIGAEEVMR